MKKGLTLPELLLATAILAVTLSLILLSYISCVFLNQTNRERTKAISHAQFVMEEIKTTTFDDISSYINNGDFDWNTATIETRGLDALNNETIDTSVNGAGLLDINIIISWTGSRQIDRQVSLQTLIARP